MADRNFDLVILSHCLDYTYGAIAWEAVRKKIETIILYGDFGHQKFIRLKNKKIYFPILNGCQKRISTVYQRQKNILENVGNKQLLARSGGETNDVGAKFAYKKRQNKINRNTLQKEFSPHSEKPIIGVYNSNWFDFPHCSGLKEFRDFLDWIQLTLTCAQERPDINWVFKAHPCDNWYGKINGQRLQDLIKNENRENIILANEKWNGLELINSLDGIVTCHGTIGIEAVSQGVPV